MTSLKHAANRRIGGYSKGRKQVVDIIYYLKQEGKTIFLSTHILSDIEQVYDRIGMLQG